MLSGGGKTTFVGGPAGPPNSLSIRTVTTGAPGSPAAAQINGAAPAQTLDLTIPQGQPGATGPSPWALPIPWTTGLVCVASAPATTVVVAGQTYVCALSHLAGTFATDLAAGRWQLVAAQGLQPWKTAPIPWASGVAYTATAPADSITYGGGSYVCTTSHTSGSAFDGTKWAQIAAPGQAPGALLAANNLSDLVSAAAAQGNLGELPTPQGRLTLVSGTPVMSASVSAASAIYYTPTGRLALVGTGLSSPPVPVFFAEVSQSLADAAKSPAAAAPSQVYDLFSWMDGSMFRVTRGPAWSAGATTGSNVARGSGAGSTALTRVSGILVNAVSIANGPGAGMGVYLGTVATDAAGATVTWSLGSAAAGGGAASLSVWNMFNRLPVAATVIDSNATWTYSGTARAADGSSGNRATVVSGLAEEPVRAEYQTQITAVAGQAWLYIGLDSTSAQAAGSRSAWAGAASLPGPATYAANLLGLHFLQALEATTGGSATFAGAPYGALTVSLRM